MIGPVFFAAQMSGLKRPRSARSGIQALVLCPRGGSPEQVVARVDRMMLRDRKFADSSLEGEGFEPSVPREGNYARERPRLVCGAAGRGRAARRWRDWQREGGGLAGTGLRDTTQIAPAEHRRDGLELNGRGCAA